MAKQFHQRQEMHTIPLVIVVIEIRWTIITTPGRIRGGTRGGERQDTEQRARTDVHCSNGEFGIRNVANY